MAPAKRSAKASVPFCWIPFAEEKSFLGKTPTDASVRLLENLRVEVELHPTEEKIRFIVSDPSDAEADQGWFVEPITLSEPDDANSQGVYCRLIQHYLRVTFKGRHFDTLPLADRDTFHKLKDNADATLAMAHLTAFHIRGHETFMAAAEYTATLTYFLTRVLEFRVQARLALMYPKQFRGASKPRKNQPVPGVLDQVVNLAINPDMPIDPVLGTYKFDFQVPLFEGSDFDDDAL